ncbi:hypothetical protein R6G85_06745 [Actinotignum urinale]|uniref:DUF222 domain-containing protein n=1 Tax=Actinotignum urinale TaxID=190146 RepID=A0ABU5G910_9ACTO|nr:hypothetical protein [Actinotignum urinale]MDY5133640.1 hypothetical protein [Actinotignum urinale]MDY5152171.1 hypothetical protein [Actinotignum urinale]
MFTCKPWLRFADSGTGDGGGNTPPVPAETVSKADYDALQAKYAQLEQSTNLALEVANGKVKEFETANATAQLDIERYKIAMSQGLAEYNYLADGPPATWLTFQTMVVVRSGPGVPPARMGRVARQTSERIKIALFAGEAKIPVSSLGVGLSQANPTSAKSYIASREDLITEAEDTARAWSASKARTIQRAWQIANISVEPGSGLQVLPALPEELKTVVPVWRDPRFTSRSQSADATMKLVTAFPWMADSDTALELLGFDELTTCRLKSEKRRLKARSLIEQLASQPTAEPSVEVSDERNRLLVSVDSSL